MDGKEIPNFVVKVSHEAKLRELLRNITSSEIKLYIDASIEFIKLLRRNPGLRSVLFGSVTLDQLVQISGREDGGLAT